MLPIITYRRSIFPQFFTNRPIERAVVEELIEAANLAPSHRKTEPWRFRVYEGKGKAKLKEELLTVYGREREEAPAIAQKIRQEDRPVGGRAAHLFAPG